MLQPGIEGLLYVGTSKNLRTRDHRALEHSGFSTLRRSLGALLKVELQLVAGPRAAGPSATNKRNYRFLGTGEKELALWMRQHLLYASFALPLAEATSIEAGLIRLLCPTLNLNGWTNPQASEIKTLSNRCVLEASTRLATGVD